ncbi:MAG: hypothetical protein AAGC67_15195 [Myxococcota bacterium]
MIGWALGIGVGIVGTFVWRAWRKDAAIKSGEVMDVRDLLPEGEGDCLVRVLGERLYRVELQLEATLPATASSDLPCSLVIDRLDDDGSDAIVWSGTRSLAELRTFAAGAETQPGGSVRFWGSVPLLEFKSPAIVRLRFEVSLPLGESGVRIDKATLVVKEDVRPMVASKKRLDRVWIPVPMRA